MKNDELNAFYNTIAMLFIGLTLVICLVTLGWLSGSLPVPDALAPSTDVPVPTEVPLNPWTVTPSLEESRTDEAVPLPSGDITTPTPGTESQ